MKHSTLGLTTSTLMGKQQLRKLGQLVQALLDNSDSHQFRQPVDWKTLGLADYLSIVKYPMDLSTVKKKLMANCYSTVQECLDQIQVVWDNCKIYNPKGVWIHNQADKLQKIFKKMIKNYLPFITNIKKQQKKKEQKKIVVKIPQPEPLPVQIKVEPIIQTEQERLIIAPRRKFIQRCALCTSEQLGIIFLLLKSSKPEAFTVSQGSVKIQTQLLDEKILKRLDVQLDMWGIGFQTVQKKK